MNITSTSSHPAGPPGVAGTPGTFPATPSAAAASAAGSTDLPSGSATASAALQTAASYLQVASGYLGRINGVLSQMAAMASAPAGASPAGSAEQFSDLQQELRGIVGGSPSEIGGPKADAPVGATFGGDSLFGPSAGVTASTGPDSIPLVMGGAANLRQGAIRILIAQDSSGGFAIGAADPGAAGTVSEASQQARAAAASLAAAQATLAVAASGTRVDASQAASVPASPAAAAAALQIAVGAIVGSPGIAVAAQSPRLSASLVGLLQFA